MLQSSAAAMFLGFLLSSLLFFFPLKSLRSPHLVITPSSYIYNTCEPNGSYRSRSWCISVWADDKASEEERADPLTDQYMY